MNDAEYKATFGWFPDDDHRGVKSKERREKFGEVLTPRWLVEKMLDEVPDVGKIDATVFEPCCGEGAFITRVLVRKLARARTYQSKLRACKSCYGIDIQYDNVLICRKKLTQIATDNGVSYYDAAYVFARNIIHGDMLFFPMLARFFDWEKGTWATLEEMTSQKELI